MRYVLLAQIVLASVAFAADKPASCELAKKSIVSMSPSGLPQVSNLGNIEIMCRVQGVRPIPRIGLKAKTTAFEISSDGSKNLVPSEVNVTGGGFDPGTESVVFSVHIPLEPAERDEEVRRLYAKLEKFEKPQQISAETREQRLKKITELVNQHRVGRFQLECDAMDGENVIGVGNIEFEVLFKGRFSDVGPSDDSHKTESPQ
jgi:hypothetical protein